MRISSLLALLVLCLCACGDDPKCRDADGDGYGEGCDKGPDCDDSDSEHAERCSDAGLPDCESERFVEGCECLRDEHAECYAAPLDTQGIGMCHAGELHCTDEGVFSACEGAVLPEAEACNRRDDDCDGLIDEGVLSPCGGCNESCLGGVWGPPLSPFEGNDALELTRDGELTLRRTLRESRSLWVANTAEGTVSKIDLSSTREVARYRSAGGNPVRVAVDHRGDAFVLDQSVHGPSMLTKIAGDKSGCVAADGGSVVTSKGPNDVLPLGKDDCVILRVPVGDAGDVAQALAIDGARAPDSELAGNVWVGLSHSHEVLELDGTTGKQLSRVATPKLAPYVADFDTLGALWLVDRDGFLGRIDPSTEPKRFDLVEVPLTCFSLESIAVDAEGRLLLGGFSCENVVSFDPLRERFEQTMTSDLLTPRGISIHGDDAWVAFTSGKLGHITREPSFSIDATYALGKDELSPYEAIGTSVDSTGRVWVVSASGGKGGYGLVTGFDPVTESVSAQITVGLGPRAQGDMTGVALGGDAVSKGVVSHVFAGCGHESRAGDAGLAGRLTHWDRVHLDAQTTQDARVRVEARWASNEAGLDAESFVVLGTVPDDALPYPVDFAEGGVVEVRLTLLADGALVAPRIAHVGVEWTCPGPD